MYRLLIKHFAEQDLRVLPQAIFDRINAKILALRDDPRPSGVRRLSGSMQGWRIRVGDYRIVYQIDDDAHAVTIVRVKHRREAYR
jgi:mRNA interferase RelE/StbE